MKHLTAMLLGCFFTMTLFAQTIKIKDNIATVNGTPYCIIEKSGTLVSNYSIKSLDGNELIYIKKEVLNLLSKEVKTYHVVMVLETEETFEM